MQNVIQEEIVEEFLRRNPEVEFDFGTYQAWEGVPCLVNWRTGKTLVFLCEIRKWNNGAFLITSLTNETLREKLIEAWKKLRRC